MSKTAHIKWREMINLIWLRYLVITKSLSLIRIAFLFISSVPICLVFSILLASIWAAYLEQPDPAVIPHYHVAVIAFALSALIEMVAEPLYITAQILLYVRLKVRELLSGETVFLNYFSVSAGHY
jgi:oligosaccharide translocation protein RFT1